jgi:hypothetical protein
MPKMPASLSSRHLANAGPDTSVKAKRSMAVGTTRVNSCYLRNARSLPRADQKWACFTKRSFYSLFASSCLYPGKTLPARRRSALLEALHRIAVGAVQCSGLDAFAIGALLRPDLVGVSEVVEIVVGRREPYVGFDGPVVRRVDDAEGSMYRGTLSRRRRKRRR